MDDANEDGVVWRPALAMVGSRDGTQVIHFGDGFYYYRHNDRAGSPFVSLRCTKYRRQGVLCRGRAVMSRDRQYYAITRRHTGHAADVHFVAERELRGRILERVRSGEATPHAMIVRDEGIRGRYSAEVRSRLPASRLRSAMWNARGEYLPRIPRNLPVLGHYLSDPQYQRVTQTIDGQDSLFAGMCGLYAAGTVSLVFMSRRMMDLLQRQRQIFVDGTFRKRPRQPSSSQIFSISIIWTNEATNTRHTITVARILMQTRTEEAYVTLLEYLLTLMPQFNPELIHCDNERGLINALRAVFPQARIVPCLWHYAVDVFRYSKSLGLHHAMETSWVLDSIVRCLCVIPLLPTHQLYAGLLEVGHWARRSGQMHSPLVRDLFRYMERQWMSQQQILSVYGCPDRTNNVSESSHAGLNWHLRQDRPNVYELIRSFLLQEDQFMVDVHALSDGRDAGRAVRVSTIYNDDRIRNLTDSLNQNRISILQFLRSASRTLQAPYDLVFG